MLISLIRKKTHYIIYGFAVIFVVSCFYMYGMNRAGNAGQGAPPEKKISKNVVSIDGTIINRLTFTNKYLQMKQQYEQMMGTSFDSYPMQKYLEAIVADYLVNQELLLQEAKKRNIKVDGAEVNKRINMEMNAYVGGANENSDPSIQGRIKGFFGSKDRMDAFKDILYRRGLTYEDYKAMIEKEVLKDTVTKAIAAEKKDEEKKKALDKANDLLEKLKTGEYFEILAMQFSDDQSTKTKGGEIGWINHGMITPELEKVAFSLQPDQYSQPIESPMGYHIIKVTDKKLPEGPEYEAEKANIVAAIKAEKGDENAVINEDEIKIKYERVKVSHILSKFPEDGELAQEWVNAEREKGTHKIEYLDPDLKAYRYLNRQMLEPGATPPDLDEAITLYKAAIDKDEDNQYLHYQLGSVYERKNNMLNVEALTSEAAEPGADPYAAAMVETENAENSEVESTTEGTVEAPENSEEATVVEDEAEKEAAEPSSEGKEVNSNKYLDEAYEEYAKAVSLSDKAQYYDPMILMGAARVADKLGKADDAVTYYVKAIDFSPADKAQLETIKDALAKYNSTQAGEALKIVDERIAEYEQMEAEEEAYNESMPGVDIGEEQDPYEAAAQEIGDIQPEEPIVDETEVPLETAPAPVPES